MIRFIRERADLREEDCYKEVFVRGHSLVRKNNCIPSSGRGLENHCMPFIRSAKKSIKRPSNLETSVDICGLWGLLTRGVRLICILHHFTLKVLPVNIT